MSFNKLESYSNKEVIREEVSILTDLLADITQSILGPETFEKISTMKDLAIDSRYQELKAIVEKLTTDEMVYISRYFSILPLLINISEDVDLAYEINHQNNVNRDYLGKLSTTIDLISTRENAQEILENLNVVPVLTAHPTQVQRKTMLDLTNHIHTLLRQHRDVKAGLVNEKKWLANLRRYIMAWNVGGYVSNKLKTEEWGSKVVTQLSEYIRTKQPKLKGYSRRSVYNMVQFYEEYSSENFLSIASQYLSKEFVQPKIAQTNDKPLIQDYQGIDTYCFLSSWLHC